ncbi:hypothetical protein QMA71_19570 [Pseudomonas otitidis]|uniref:hypothetical protein n=1 Tax=Metapseudomonas otitidis TaxID=319939 RepID=UPI0024AE11F7|nr:hypothetical protein [Pseudomonas otitidis]MDI6527743.1 hypothetical protein [Pseudomonas otitidis]
MTLSDVVPAPLRVFVLVALVAAGAGLAWWVIAPRIDQQEARAESAERQLQELQAIVQQLSGQLTRQQATFDQLVQIERRLQQLGQTVNRNTSAQTAAFEELRRNDREIAAYLVSPVPSALGRLYERPETTDPAAWHAPDGMFPSAVRTAGAASGSGQ